MLTVSSLLRMTDMAFKKDCPDLVFTAISGVWLMLFMHIPFYNLGGSGFILPQNIMTWIVVAVLCGGVIFVNPIKKIIITPFFIVLLVGSLLMTIPLLWSLNQAAVSSATARYCGMWAGCVFYFCLLQIKFTGKTIRIFLWFIAFSAAVESCIVLQTLFLPGTLNETSLRFYTNSGRDALGIFQQVNVTASWLATGLAAQIVLLLRGGGRNTGRGEVINGSHVVKLAASVIILVLLSACIVLTQSRIGWLGGSLCYLIMCLSLPVLLNTCLLQLVQMFILLLAPLAGIVTGLMLLDCSVAQAISHTASNHQRLLVLKETWQMIMLHPLKGWGPGAFRSAFQNYMASHFAINPSHEVMSHPHNELLYIWFEGGISALTGYLLIILAMGWLIFSRPCIQRRVTGIILLPVMLHTWTEFPFYYSTAHFVVLLILLAILDLSGRSGHPGFTIPGNMRPTFTFARSVVVLVSACIILWLIKAFTMESLLCHFEDGTLGDPDSISLVTAPPLTAERYSHDLNLLNLVHYYGSGDHQFLKDYLTINAGWLIGHPEPDDYDNQIRVLLVMGQTKMAEKYRISASQLFPWDQRFSGDSHAE